LCTRKCFIGVQRLFRAELLLRPLLSGVIDSESSNRMAESLLMFVPHPEIPLSSVFSQGNLESILSNWYVQAGLESWNLHQQDLYPQQQKI